jgi:TonB family protein
MIQKNSTKKFKNPALTSIIFTPFLIVAALAQNPSQNNGGQTCRGPIYSAQEVTHRAITDPLDLNITEEARVHNVHGRVVIQAVLCRTGRVADLKVIESLPYGMTENALEVVRHLKFKPAEKNWHTVSQGMRFEFQINGGGIEGIDPREAAGRLVEGVEVIGNRRLTAQQILALMRTRAGDPISYDQITRDLNAILATGYVDKLRTRVSIEQGVRGGVVIVFEVFELPLIREVKFEGLGQFDQSTIVDALLKEPIDVRKGATYRVAVMKDAIRIIKQILESKGQRNVKVQVLTENVTATTVSLTFVITGE